MIAGTIFAPSRPIKFPSTSDKNTIGSHSGDVVDTFHPTNADRLSLIVETESRLPGPGQVFESLAIHRAAGADTDGEASHLHIPDQKGTIDIAVGQIRANLALAIL